MPAKKHPVILSVTEQSALEQAARSNQRSLRERQGARILPASAKGQSDAEVAWAVSVHPNPVVNPRKRFAPARTQSVRRAEQKRRQARALDG